MTQHLKDLAPPLPQSPAPLLSFTPLQKPRVNYSNQSKYELPTCEQILLMGKEELAQNKKIIQEAIDPTEKSGLKGLGRNKYFAMLGNITQQLSAQSDDHSKPKPFK